MLTFLSGGDEGQEVKIAIQALGEVTSYGVHEKTERIYRKRWAMEEKPPDEKVG